MKKRMKQADLMNHALRVAEYLHVDIEDEQTLSDLLEMAEDESPHVRVDWMSFHPEDLSEPLPSCSYVQL